jgi:uncharacterized Fe-S cluster-containing radical SAM superfamily protein
VKVLILLPILIFLLGLIPLMPDTIILKNEEGLIGYLIRFLENRKSPLKLCYRASLHGWSGQDFHKLCDDKAGTVVLVKFGNWIFGDTLIKPGKVRITDNVVGCCLSYVICYGYFYPI